MACVLPKGAAAAVRDDTLERLDVAIEVLKELLESLPVMKPHPDDFRPFRVIGPPPLEWLPRPVPPAPPSDVA